MVFPDHIASKFNQKNIISMEEFFNEETGSPKLLLIDLKSILKDYY